MVLVMEVNSDDMEMVVLAMEVNICVDIHSRWR